MSSTIGTITNEAYIGVGAFLIALTVAFIAARCTISIRQYRKLVVDDWLTIIGFVIAVGLYGFNEYQYQRFFQPTSLDYFTASGVAVPVLAAFSMWTSKAPVLILYIRLFGIQKWMRYACYITIVASALGFFLSMIPSWRSCHPFDVATPVTWRVCGQANLDGGVIQGSLSVVVDLIIILLPLRPIYTLNMSRRMKIGLGIVFLSGIFGVLASVLSLVYKVHLFRGGRSDLGGILTAMLLQFVECTIALMVGCVPSVRGFWKGSIVPSRFYASLGAIGSRVHINPARWTSRSSKSSKRSGKSDGGYHDLDLENGGSQIYVRMEPLRVSNSGSAPRHNQADRA